MGESDETRFKDVLREEVDHVLEALADRDLVEETDIALADDEGEGADGE
jgi:phage terminase Nu1 subunit (DNA packaging protein)